ncbi:hypothetical protein CPB85DRAFT_1329152 [Mucidula mucida]|nr:hypothetical protein CPB85DRAFT_1329152 [Mucidula mucida]
MSSTSLRTDRVRVIVLSKRKEGITKEEFSNHWLGVHGPLAMESKIFTEKILKYEQLHVNDAANSLLSSLGLTTGDWDGVGLFEAKSFDDIIELFKSEDFVKGPLGSGPHGDCPNFVSAAPQDFIVIPLDVATFFDK